MKRADAMGALGRTSMAPWRKECLQPFRVVFRLFSIDSMPLFRSVLSALTYFHIFCLGVCGKKREALEIVHVVAMVVVLVERTACSPAISATPRGGNGERHRRLRKDVVGRSFHWHGTARHGTAAGRD